MQKITLIDYLKNKTLAAAAEDIGVTQGAVWQMTRTNRQIELTIHSDGRIETHEKKPLGRTKTAA
jgi:hypothetical protein